MMSARVSVTVLLASLLAVAGCTTAPAETAVEPSAAADSGGLLQGATAERVERVLSRLPECEGAPQATVTGDDVEGLVAPDGARWTGLETDGPLTTVTGWVELTPVQIRGFYERTTIGVLKTLMIEDEILEAEALMESRTHRLYVKAQAACQTASNLWIVLAENEAPADLPRPGSSDVPGPPAPTPAP